MTEPGRVAVVTGAATGIGAATAVALAADAWAVALVARRGDPVDEAAAVVRDRGVRALPLESDVRDPAAVAAAADTVVTRLGRIDALVTCAGIGRIAALEDTDDALWDDTLATNLTGTFLWCRAALPHLRSSRGVVVAVASTTALQGLPGRCAYAASKGGVIAFARTLAIEAAPDVRVVSVSPGATLTSLVAQGYAAAEDPAAAAAQHAAVQPIGRLSSPQEIAATIAFLCSPAAATVTGTNVVVDGGHTAGGTTWST